MVPPTKSLMTVYCRRKYSSRIITAVKIFIAHKFVIRHLKKTSIFCKKRQYLKVYAFECIIGQNLSSYV